MELYVATPCFGNKVEADYMIDMMNLDYACHQWGIPFDIRLIGNLPMLPLARSTCVKHFLESGFSHMLFVDADVSFNPFNAKRLLDANKDICCSIYPKKAIYWSRLIGKTFASVPELEQASLEYTHNNKAGTEVDENGFLEVNTAATGFMLIKRVVIEKMIEAYPELQFKPNYRANDVWADDKNLYALFDPMIDPVTREYHGDDNAFCKRWTGIGGQIYVDTLNPLTHLGVHHFGRHKDQ